MFLRDRAAEEGASADVKTQWNYRDKTQGQERVLCLDEATGKVLWMHDYPCAYETAYGFGPRARPSVCGDRIYALGAMGDLRCLHAATGRGVWQKNFVRDYRAVVPLYEPHERWSTLFMVPHGDRVFIWNDHGDLILARLTPAGYHEISRAHVLEPDMPSTGSGGRRVVWSHPAFANRCLYGLVKNHSEYWSLDGVHFNDQGVAVQVEQVAKRIAENLD